MRDPTSSSIKNGEATICNYTMAAVRNSKNGKCFLVMCVGLFLLPGDNVPRPFVRFLLNPNIIVDRHCAIPVPIKRGLNKLLQGLFIIGTMA